MPRVGRGVVEGVNLGAAANVLDECRHGTEGAAHDHRVCSACVHEAVCDTRTVELPPTPWRTILMGYGALFGAAFVVALAVLAAVRLMGCG